MQPDEQLDAIAADGSALADAAAAGLDSRVPSCPGWDVAKLVLHVGLVHTWVAESVRRRSPEAVDRAQLPRAPDGAMRVGWLRSATTSLLAALGGADDDGPAGIWRDRRVTAGFWRRRMAHETAVHRWDAQAATGKPEQVVPSLSVDGIAEVLEVFLPLSLSAGSPSPAAPSSPAVSRGRAASPRPTLGSLHLHCADADGEWSLSVAGEGLVVTPGHAKADAAIRGDASDLFLTCWGRRPEHDPEVLGDRAVADGWLALMGW